MTNGPNDWFERKARIACLGLSAFDYIWGVQALPGGTNAKVLAREFEVKGGGMAATAAVTIARLGGEASFIGRAGADREGASMKDELAAEGVDVSSFRLFDGARSSISGVFVDGDGERQIANFRGEGLPVGAEWLPVETMGKCGAILCDPRWPEGAVAAFEAGRLSAVPTVLDGDVAEEAVFDRLLPLSDHAIFSEPALRAYAGSSDERALRSVHERHGCGITAVTRGARGVLRLESDEILHTPAFPVEAIDTTGAGDVFHGAYAFAIARTAPVEDAMSFAAAVAALKCTCPNGRSGIPTLQASLSFWRTH